MVATCRFNEDRLNLKIWMASFHTWGLERLPSNTWRIEGKSWVQLMVTMLLHLFSFLLFWQLIFFQFVCNKLCSFIEGDKGNWMMIESLGLKIFFYFLQIVGWHANKQNLDDVLQAMLFFWESLSKLKVVSTVFNYKYLVWESCKILRVSWASQYSFKQWANKSTKRI